MKGLGNIITALVIALALYCAGLATLLIYGVVTLDASCQLSALFILLVAGFGTDGKRKINNRIKNPYDGN